MSIAARSCASAVVAVIGNPNTGKTTLFNALTGLSQRVGNYPGVTVERKSGFLKIDETDVELVDLPGTYSLAARSLDEMIAVDVLLGKVADVGPVDVAVVVVDAGNPDRNLFLVSQVLELGLPTIVALNMVDGAEKKGLAVDAATLAERLGVPVVPMRADRGTGLAELRAAVAGQLRDRRLPQAPPVPFPDAFSAALDTLEQETAALRPHATTPPATRPELLRALVDRDGAAEARLAAQLPQGFRPALGRARTAAADGRPLAAIEAEARYRWAREILAPAITRGTRPRTRSERIDAVLTHRVFGLGALLLALGVVFQAVYLGATPLMDLIEAGFGWLGSTAAAALPDGALESLVVDGLIGSVGGVVIFLPQILVLFFFLSVLEDCGYMARVAFLLDKLLAWAGLSGKAVIPLLSSFACGVPGIMAARTIEDRRDRLATILVAPLMSCSARLPVYVLLIGAFVPNTLIGGWLSLQAVCLLAAHVVGLAIAVPAVMLFKKTFLRGPAIPFVMELPEYRWPSWLSVADRLLIRGRAFLVRAGTVIAAIGVLVWAASYFPRPEALHQQYEAQRATATPERQASLDQQEAAAYLEQSYLGRLGHVIEPAFRPMGWDWRIGVAVLASFPAREVVIATMGTIFGVGSDADETSGELRAVLKDARRADGAPLFDTAVGLSLVVFFALCCQCVATLAVIRRETGSWGWAAFAFTYMTALAWVAAWATYRLVAAAA